MGRRFTFLAALLGALIVAGVGPSPAPALGPPAPPPELEVIVFHGDGCPYCARALDFVDDLRDRWPDLTVTDYEVWYDAGNRAIFQAAGQHYGFDAGPVPVVILAGQVWIGFDAVVADELEARVEALYEGVAPPPTERTTIDVPFVGRVDVGDRSLVLATLLIGFVDGVNPCSLWVLSMLLALVLHSGSRRRVLLVGGLFLLITSVLYGLYMVGFYSVLDVAGEAVWLRITVVVVAGGLGLLHLKEYVTNRGLSVTIPDAHKPGLYRRMRSLASADRSLPAVLGSTALLAIAVSLLETPCTAGLPLLWTNLLTARGVDGLGAVVLFLLYLSVFLLDELIVFGLAVFTMRAMKVQEHHGRALQLISGTLMVTLALTMLVAPAVLESLRGTALIFGLAGAFVAVVLLAEHLRQGRGVSPRYRPGARSR